MKTHIGHSYKITISYRGTRYYGWQCQAGKQKTIQGEINKALRKICKVGPRSEKVKSVGSGRTDAGVHALAQVMRADLPLQIAPESLVKALNSHLDDDIRALEAHVCSPHFRPVQDALWKEYFYLFTNTSNPHPLFADLVSYLSYPLDLKAMEKAAQLFVGTHDFANFFTTGTPVKSTVRTIYSCEFRAAQDSDVWGQVLGPYFIFKVRGNGFLKQMVRLMVGALWSVGRGKCSLQDLEDALRVKISKKLGAVAPASGLYLSRVCYEESFKG